jgi:hypothetical protein
MQGDTGKARAAYQDFLTLRLGKITTEGKRLEAYEMSRWSAAAGCSVVLN